MPKRKSRGSGWSGSPRKSPRKSGGRNANVSSEDVNTEEEKERPPNVKFQFQDVDEEEEENVMMELEVNPLDVLVCVDKEESANENQVPCKNKSEAESLSNRNLQLVSSCPASLKRASPLSPTLLDNVQKVKVLVQAQTLAVAPPTSVLPNESTDNSVEEEKSDIETDPSTLSSNLNLTAIDEEGKTRLLNGSATAEVAEHLEVTIKTEEQQEETSDSITSKKASHLITQPPISTPATTTNTAFPTSERIELPKAVFRIIEDYTHPIIPFMNKDKDQYLKWTPRSKVDLCKDVEYELDEVDISWLEIMNKLRENFHGLDLGKVEMEEMELLMDRLEKEHYYELQNNGMGKPEESDEDAVCCICLDGESDNSNQIIFCDMCNIPVHQDCYGVPFIPEGSWLCRRCSISPNADIECVFCPNKDGALKQTADGRWAHVVCALWIPEVRFSNPSLVEPVDDICDIPPARWRLMCFLCKRKGVGACIQCHLRTCVTAFHPSCAQKAGLSLKVETRDSVTNPVRLKPSCDKHTSEKTREHLLEKIKTLTKVLQEKKFDQPEKKYPSISIDRREAITDLVTFPGKKIFFKRLYAYWKIKRNHRGGAPLLRDPESCYIQSEKYPFSPPPIQRTSGINREIIYKCYKNMSTMFKELHKYKEFCGMIKEYHELAKEELEARLRTEILQVENLNPLYLDVIEKLKAKDKKEIFQVPVTDDEAPDYSTIIKNPMDLSTMQQKVFKLEYTSLEDMEADFILMINNCLTYNKKSTVYHKSAHKMKDDGERIFDQARAEQQRQIELEEQKETERREAKERIRNVFLAIVNKLVKYDTLEIFLQPVDPVEVPDYLTHIKNPMDLSTMKKKIDEEKYSSIEDLEADFQLMINNCFLFNEDDSDYFKIGRKMKAYGERVFKESKHTNPFATAKCISGYNKNSDERNNNDVDEDQDDSEGDSEDDDSGNTEEDDDSKSQKTSEEHLFEIMTETLKSLVEEDDHDVFIEPVSLEDCPDYFDVIETAMDFSTMEMKLKNREYSALEDMEKDYNLMINNCKVYNGRNSDFYGIAVDMKRVGTRIFGKARRQVRSKCRTTL